VAGFTQKLCEASCQDATAHEVVQLVGDEAGQGAAVGRVGPLLPCAIGQTDAAREAALHLSDSKREAVRAMCMKNGVTIE